MQLLHWIVVFPTRPAQRRCGAALSKEGEKQQALGHIALRGAPVHGPFPLHFSQKSFAWYVRGLSAPRTDSSKVTARSEAARESGSRLRGSERHYHPVPPGGSAGTIVGETRPRARPSRGGSRSSPWASGCSTCSPRTRPRTARGGAFRRPSPPAQAERVVRISSRREALRGVHGVF